MASAIPVPGQPGRLFIPGVGVIDQRSRSGRPLAGYETKNISVDEGHMTISDVSTQDLEDYERDSINGLGATAPVPAPTQTATAVVKAMEPPYPWRQGAKGQDVKLLQAALMAAGWPLAEPSGIYGPRTSLAISLLLRRAKYAGDLKQFDAAASAALKALSKDTLKPTEAEVKQVAAMTTDAEWAASVRTDLTQDGGPPTVPAAGGFTELFKNPWYWVGVAAVVGGIWWFMKNRAPVRQVSAVETLGLEGIKAPKRRKSRRKSRKSKKAQE